MPAKQIAIIGAGLVGLATAIKIKTARPAWNVTVWEKEKDAGLHQSTHNSGVLHAGLYYTPGSLKATLAVKGIREMTAFCVEHGIAHEICGKLVVATNESELSRLDRLQERGEANGLQAVRKVTREELNELEPLVGGLAAIEVPEEGIVDYRAVVAAMKRVLASLGADVRTADGVRSLWHASGKWHIESVQGGGGADFLVNCAGLQSDRVARMAGEEPSTRIVPFRGEYYCLRDGMNVAQRRLIYPVPDPAFPFLGVHFTRLIHGGVEAGPNAVLALARESYSRWGFNLRDMGESLGFKGLWSFLSAHPRTCAQELWCSLSRSAFCKALQKLVPSVQEGDLLPGGTGVRAQAMKPDGTLVQDFDFIERGSALHVLNAPSPGATASLAIGAYVAGKVFGLAGMN
jgi:L-2-hydroxyglutarate oxidase